MGDRTITRNTKEPSACLIFLARVVLSRHDGKSYALRGR